VRALPRSDAERRIRVDDWEMQDDVQEEVHRIWDDVTEENLPEVAGRGGIHADFLQIHGFGFDGVDTMPM
jgi:enoyl-[acyl-carrier protein] reductase/trans-2-enoyl-CoA reductase (NAD+)